MARKISGALYKVTYTATTHAFVECSSLHDLYEYVATEMSEGNIVTSVTEIRKDGATPRVSVLTSKEFKNILKKKTRPIVEVREEFHLIVDSDTVGIEYDLIPVTDEGKKLIKGFHYYNGDFFSVLFSPYEEARYKAEDWISNIADVARVVILNNN